MPTAPAKKQIGKGTKVLIDTVEVGRIENAQLPETEYALVEGDELIPLDAAGNPVETEIPELGDLLPKDWEFTQYYDPLHASATSLDTKMAAKAEVTVAIVTGHAAAVKFSGKGLIYKMSVPQITKTGFYKRVVTIRQTTPLVIAANA